MAISKTQIINKALTLCGASTVVSIDDGTTNANVLSNVYEIALRSILSECKWNFATVRANLSQVPDTLAFDDIGNKYVYTLPTDVIRIYSTNPPYAQWREESGMIITDSANFGIRYVQFLDVPSQYPSFFIDAFVDKLCSEISYAIINSANIADAFIKKYEGVSLPKAMSMNSQSGIQQALQDGYWEMSKYYNGCTGDDRGATVI